MLQALNGCFESPTEEFPANLFLRSANNRRLVSHPLYTIQPITTNILSSGVLLMYPHTSKLEAQDVIFHTTDDITYPRAYLAVNSPPIRRLGLTEIPLASEKIVQYLATQLRLLGTPTSNDLGRAVCKWMVLNIQTTFWESIDSSIDYWTYASSRERSQNVGTIINSNENLLYRLRETVGIKIRHLEKARTECEVLTKFGNLDTNTVIHITQAWSPLSSSPNSMTEDIEKLRRAEVADVHRIMTNRQIEAPRTARTAIQQAETIKWLAKLAFIFIPISAFCSAFGMNVRELPHNQPPVWVPILVMSLITITSIVLSLDTLYNIMRDFIWAMKCISGPFMFSYTSVRPGELSGMLLPSRRPNSQCSHGYHFTHQRNHGVSHNINGGFSIPPSCYSASAACLGLLWRNLPGVGKCTGSSAKRNGFLITGQKIRNSKLSTGSSIDSRYETSRKPGTPRLFAIYPLMGSLLASQGSKDRCNKNHIQGTLSFRTLHSFPGSDPFLIYAE